MIDEDSVQAALIGYLQADPVLVNLLGGKATEIRESSYQGADFSYPAIRLRVGPQTDPHLEAMCQYSTIEFQVDCYSEQKSSKEATEIGWEINELLHHHSFSYMGVFFSLIDLVSSLPVARKDERTWIKTVRFSSHVQVKP
jgi:hypothetical protein